MHAGPALILSAVATIASAPFFARAQALSSPITERRMPELSDIALFLCAVGAVWFVRSRLRARFRNRSDDAPKD